MFPAFSQNVKTADDPTKADLVATLELLVKKDNEAKIDSLIVELDGLISTINAAHDERHPAKKTKSPS